MKHLSYLLLGAVGLTLASCSNEDLVSNVSNPDGTANVTVTLDLPQIKTRAYSDGKSAQKLQYAVYKLTKDANGDVTSKELMVDLTKNNEQILLQKQVDFKLVTGHTYGLVFWAANADAPYYIEFSNNGANMTVDYNDERVCANNEKLDAFYAYKEVTVNGDASEKVYLYRPFAQINVGTSDLGDAEKAGYTPVYSHVKVKSLYDKLDLISGAVSMNDGSTTIKEHDFAYSQIPTGETFPVNGHDYLAMVYALVDNEDDQPLVDVEFCVTDAAGSTGEHAAEHKVSSVPVKRNHRTNIYGQLLISNVDVNVIIEPAYELPDYPKDALSKFQLEAQLGGTVVLEDNIDLKDNQIYITKSTVIDLNGHTITGTAQGVIKVDDPAAQLTIRGNGTIKNTAESSNIVLWARQGEIYIENGNFTSNGKDEMIYAGGEEENGNLTKATIYIKGGTFQTTSDDPDAVKYLLNCYNAGYLDNKKANIVVSGGTFYGYNPAKSESEDPAANFVAVGYQSIETTDSDNNKVYTVIPATAILVDTNDNISDVLSDLKDGDVIFIKAEETTIPAALPEGIAYTIKGVSPDKTNLNLPLAYNTAKDAIITLSDLTITGFHGTTGTSVAFTNAKEVYLNNVNVNAEFHVKPGTDKVYFNDCVFNYDVLTDALNGGRYGAYLEGGNDIVFNNCIFDNSESEIKSKGILVYASEIGDITLNNCEIIGSKVDNENGAVEIHTESQTKAGTLTINNTTFDSTHYKGGLWREVNGSTKAPTKWFTVIVDGQTVQEAESK